MDTVVCESSSPPVQIKNEHQGQKNEQESIEKFQKFIFDLFEKNGILNDLRSYLRKHIVSVLKNAQIGDKPACQTHFVQRLEHANQACNMLIAEYLLCYEFSYTSSVFVSEIPLANMAFDIVKDIMKCNTETHIRFKEKDVCSILNYLGIKCSSDFVSDVIDMYTKNDHIPLLLCILKCFPTSERNLSWVEDEKTSLNSTIDSSLTNDSSAESEKMSKKSSTKCRHLDNCKNCQSKVDQLRRRYKKKRVAFIKKHASISSLTVKMLMKKIMNIEDSLMDELFQQLTSVYDAELDMIRAEQEEKVKRSFATHAMQLQQQKRKMEEELKEREQEFERNVRQKKKFLWGLARSLRDQHELMARAMRSVRHQAQAARNKEDSMTYHKKQAELLQSAVDSEMTKDCVVLEKDVSVIKKSRDALRRERSVFEQMKVKFTDSCDSKIHETDEDSSHNVNRNVGFMDEEIAKLKSFVDSSTITVLNNITSKLNIENSEHVSPTVTERDKAKNQLLIDLKKFRNSNLCMGLAASSSPRQTTPRRAFVEHAPRNTHRSAYSSPVRTVLSKLQSAPVTSIQVSVSPAPLALFPSAEGPHCAGPNRGNRSITAPTVFPNCNNPGVCVPGGGESPRSAVQAVPALESDVMRDRHADLRRHLISQWRAARQLAAERRAARRGAARGAARRGRRAHDTTDMTASSSPSAEKPIKDSDKNSTLDENLKPSPRAKSVTTKEEEDRMKTIRCKSPKSVLKEAKDNLRTPNTKSPTAAASSRDKSPSTVLRDAKLRLRKLEIEAEVVEQSYRDFRKRQSELRSEYEPMPVHDEAIVTRDNQTIGGSKSLQKFTKNGQTDNKRDVTQKLYEADFDKYLREYHTKFDLSETLFPKKGQAAAAISPIPAAYSYENKSEVENETNYLDASMKHFRKQYQLDTCSNDAEPTQTEKKSDEARLCQQKYIETVDTISQNLKEKKNALNKEKLIKQVELEILKSNINKIYDIDRISSSKFSDSTSSQDVKIEDSQSNKAGDDLKLRIEVENIEVNALQNMNEPDEVLLVVQSCVDAAVSCAETLSHCDELTGNMTIFISPKKCGSPTRNEFTNQKSISSLEQTSLMTRDDTFEPIFHAETAKLSCNLERDESSSKEMMDSISEVYSNTNNVDDYRDNLSGDDNYSAVTNRTPTPL